MGSCPRGFPLPWAVLLLALQAGTSELPKAEVTLDPPWINVLREDQVTLRCEGPQGQEDPSTHWFHNGSSVGAEGQHSLSFQATSEASGNYSCQTGHSRLSDPVRLAVVSDWLLLQTPAREFREGDPIVLRCHSWRNKPLTKITFYQDGVSKHFSFGNQNFSIPQANASHSGEYHCRGLIGKVAHSSAPVAISVREIPSSQSSPAVTIVAVLVALIALAMAVGVAAWWHRRRKLTSDAGPAAEGAPRKESENTISYSLLSHPEENYQNSI
ncbi:low affinity immunoglobulin gamma Fc region receptor II-b isoform X2 [Sorex fumeus]|uniref:low affinity immunoglobulin gamma Fc region receptor II-b isoform X2 n=1 Tax=Sorex fumeus TaxID=62283 RepID=UPI0024AE1AB5|nr:low affinity immunoglobulin gamma Fc region receptor II-b isoform X2 [Sorex fumeus]